MRRRTRGRKRRPTIWRLPDELWVVVQAVLPSEEFQPSGGRPWIAPRRIVDGVLYVLRTGCQWKAVPAEYGSGSTVHRRFQQWVTTGRWEQMWRRLLEYHDTTAGLDWTWQSADSSLHKAPLGGEKNGAQSHRPREEWHEAPYPHRRRGRADRHGDHGGQHA